MSDLKAFLAQNAIPMENVKYAASRRFVDDKGKPVEWELRALTSEEDEAIRRTCTHRVPIKGRKGATMPELNTVEYMCQMAVASTVFPNLNDKDLQDSYGVMDAEALIKKMLKPGEYTDYLGKVQEVNGFDISLEDQVEEAKN